MYQLNPFSDAHRSKKATASLYWIACPIINVLHLQGHLSLRLTATIAPKSRLATGGHLAIFVVVDHRGDNIAVVDKQEVGAGDEALSIPI